MKFHILFFSFLALYSVGLMRADVTVTAKPGQTVTLVLYACDGSVPMTYQWSKDGQPILGASGTITATPTDAAPQATYVMASVTTAQSGTYVCTVTNSAGSTVSDNDILQVLIPPGQAKTKGTVK